MIRSRRSEKQKKKIVICPVCHTKIEVKENKKNNDRRVIITCPVCGKKGVVHLNNTFEELDFYPVNPPYTFVKIVKDVNTLEKCYRLLEPILSEEEAKNLRILYEILMHELDIELYEINTEEARTKLRKKIDEIIEEGGFQLKNDSKIKLIYYIERDTIGYGKIDGLMRDPNIEDISCDGPKIPIYLYHRKYGSLKTNIVFKDEEEVSSFVIKLAQKCGKYVSIAEPILDGTLPDGSRVQATLGTEVTARGSTFTIRKFRADPFTPPDLIEFGTMSPEMVAYFWLVVEHGISAIFAGGTGSGKTTTLNAMALFIPREAKIVSIEETREINLPHPNWIPGVTRSGFGEVVADKVIGEIDMYDLLKAALRQRPEYIIVGEIRGREAYVLFQAMATGHTTYSTMHADSPQSLVHRLESEPINIPRVMLQALDVITIQVQTEVKGERVRRCKQVVEIIDVDPKTKEVLTNEVFRWDPAEDVFVYSGNSYILNKIQAKLGLSKEEMMEELKRRTKILEWMRKKGIRTYRDVAKIVAEYTEKPEEFMKSVEGKKRVPDTV
ncbi:MAG: type II/IV secretion system ATPase subunit [Thermoplasmata archaeon]|nr:type II/IV secretion system ATPase subunit [Thermoplasmata archaeon]